MSEKSGFVAIVGPTNAGKSTLLNAIMGRKAAIVSHKVQTTRTQLRAVKMVGESQLIFVDTPGIFKPARRLDRAMVAAATGSLSDADAVVLLSDATHGITETVRDIVNIFSPTQDSPGGGAVTRIYPAPASGGGKIPIFAAINKVDLVSKNDLLPIARQLSELADFDGIFFISATKGQGIEPMLKSLAAVMPEHPYLFDAKDLVDVPDNLWLAEITREKIYKFIHQELPYHIHISTDRVDTDPDGVLEIAQTIYVRSDGHKKIIIGRAGGQLKKIGTEARREIQDEWGVNARLKLFVRVEDWENKQEYYNEQGLDYVK